MFRKHLAGRIAALGAGLMVLLPGLAAQAVDIDLPGERRLEIHGFYEGRLRAMGQDIPFGGEGASISTFRHVLNVETDIDIFPDGWGPFDFMVGFTRWLASYECVYERGCGLFPSMDNFGGSSRKANREPLNFKHARTRMPAAGGVWGQFFRPGSLRSTRERITPNHRYRGIRNPDGVVVNPFGLAAFGNLETRTVLDQPIDGGTSVSIANDTRAGALSFDELVRQARLVSSRANLDSPALGDPFSSEFPDVDDTLSAAVLAQVATFDPSQTGRDTFQNLNDRFLFPRLDPAGQNGTVTGPLFGMLSLADRAKTQKADAEFLAAHGVPVPFVAPDDSLDDIIERNEKVAKKAILFREVPDPADPNETITIRTFDSLAQAFIFARPDNDKFAPLALANGAAQLLTMQWGVTARADSTNIGWLASIDTPIRPLGYFTSPSADLINEFATGSVGGIATIAEAPADSFRSGVFKAFYCQEIDPEADCFVPQAAPPTGDPSNVLIPRYLGPDGRRNTPDDLPIDQGDSVHKLYLTEADQVELAAIGAAQDRRDFFPLFLRNGDDRIPFVNGEFKLTEEGHPGPDGVKGTADDGCIADGVNQNGECILLTAGDKLNTVVRGVLDPEAVFLAGDRSLRPASALDEPSNLTGIATFSTGNAALPARPRNPAGGLFYETRGLKRFLDDNHKVVSNLDLDFTEDELRWEHGAGQDEHEFKEGYVEFEMLDSEIFARVGKLLWVWGKTELFRNQDRLNPVDIGLGALSRLEESRLGQWGFQVVYSPEAWMSVGPIEDMRMELVVVTDDFEPTDLGKCGEGLVFAPVCGLSFGAMAHGLVGIGVAGEVRPDSQYSGLKAWDYGVRLEGRLDRFTFAVTDFWGWDDALYLDLVHQYERRVDPFTGAPVNSTGALDCSLRQNAAGLFVGPDGDASTDTDNLVPSMGNCLLFDDTAVVHGSDEDGCQDTSCPVGETCVGTAAECAAFLSCQAAAQACFDRTGDDPVTSWIEQPVRAGADISLSHYANQTLFHTICTLTFDADAGFCAVDTLNSEALNVAIASILSGGVISELAILGTETIRTDTDYRVDSTPEVFALSTFGKLRSLPVGGRDLGSLDFRRRALLGCGSSFGSGCGEADGDITRTVLGIETTTENGVDFMNADASVLTQEFSILKAGSPFALIGHRNGKFEAGVTVPAFFDENGDFERALDVHDARVLVGEMDPTDGATAAHVRASNRIRTADGRFALSSSTEHGDIDLVTGLPLQVDIAAHDSMFGEGAIVPTDFLIEPMRWPVITVESVQEDFDTGRIDSIEQTRLLEAIDNNLLVFQDVRLDTGRDSTQADNLDLTRINPFGENCSTLFGGPDPGCTDLEIISQNLERFLIANEIIGGDDVFDPAETFQELMFMLDLDPGSDLNPFGADVDPFIKRNFGDPISGPDGIVFNDFDIDGLNGADRKAIAIQGNEASIANLLLDPGQGYNDCLARADSLDFCYETFPDPGTTESRLASAMPIGIPGEVLGASGQFEGFLIKGTALDPLDFQELISRAELEGSVLVHEADMAIVTGFDDDGNPIFKDVNGDGVIGFAEIRVSDSIASFFEKRSFGAGDLNDDLQPDLDEDRDGVFDQLDDGTAGPISDDNPLCGSGIPGDPLQQARQFEFVSTAELVKLQNRFGAEGLPVRSPVFCSSLVGILGITGQTLPLVQAGGDGRYGRRDFLWHGGRQVSLNFQKRNTFGFSLDFAEDTTKSSWGIEFSWTADKLYGDTRSATGLHSSDEYALTISVDRPTFFNFLNPNRSFFVNFQFNLRYFDDYVGGADDRDGMFATAEGPLSAFFVLTFFTGYFQDRLNPSFNFIYDSGTGNGGVLSQVGYRWNERFSTSVRLNHFFGHTTEIQGSQHPIALFGHPDTTSEIARGLAVVKNRDVAILTVRYTF